MHDCRRAAIIAEALTWIGTPFHHAARIKGVGCDCLTYIAEVYARAGIVPPQQIPFYRPDFMQHQSEETYLNGLLQHGREVAQPLQADVAIFKWGRIYAHAGIVVEWPWMLHAAPSLGVIKMRGDMGRLRGRAVKFISAFVEGDPA
jgi:NlpC/P60 family putative phage cell wall peptidase